MSVLLCCCVGASAAAGESVARRRVCADYVGGKVAIVVGDGTVVRELPMPGFACESLGLPNGNLLVCLWSPGRVIEFDKDMKIVWELRTDELPGNPLRIPYCIERLPDGNTVVGNSLIQGHIGKQPQAFEVTPDKKVVWELTDHARFKNVAYLHTLDTGK